MKSFGNVFRTRSIVKATLPFIKSDSAKILDIGAGSCHIAETLATKYGINVTAVDVVDHNLTDFPLELYDGGNLPYEEKCFGVGLLIFVLHHASDVNRLLKEAGRVCEYLVVVEDLPRNKFERAAWKRLDYVLNHAKHDDIAIAHDVRSVNDWKAVFASMGYGIAKTKRFRSFFTTGLTYPHVVFVLKRGKGLQVIGCKL